MFLKKEKIVSLQAILEQSEKQLQQAQQGNYDYTYRVTTGNEQLQQIIDNLNKVNELRETYECKLRQKLHNLTTVNNVGFWEMNLPNGKYEDPENVVEIEPTLKRMLGYQESELTRGLDDLQTLVHRECGVKVNKMIVAHLNDSTFAVRFSPSSLVLVS